MPHRRVKEVEVPAALEQMVTITNLLVRYRRKVLGLGIQYSIRKG
jgi:hypothetical protein